MRGAHGDDNQLIARRKKSTGKKYGGAKHCPALRH